MARRRRQFREIEVLETLIVHQRVAIPCFRCKIAFTEEDVKTGNIEKEHLHEFGLDGPDEPFNCRFSHKEGCHSVITNGPPATSAGSSKNRAAKANNPERRVNFIVNKPPLGTPRKEPALARPWGKRPIAGSRASGWRKPFNRPGVRR